MKVGLLALVVLAGCAPALPSRAGADRPSPEWWRKAWSIYCPAEQSGAGSALMKFWGPSLSDAIDDFRQLPGLLSDARRLGSNIVYLVGYWEGGYEHKISYVPRSDLGGPEAFRDGVKAVHDAGGRIIVYVEAFIITRRDPFSQRIAPAWAMMDEKGNFYDYPHTHDRFFCMYPGPGSGWADYLARLCAGLVRDYDVDGVHLDSYGYQTGWRDYNPRHPGADDPAMFDRYAVELVKKVRSAMRNVRPDTVVMIEGDEFTALLDVCDGAQDECLAVLKRKSWAEQHKYKVFTSEFSLAQMDRILDFGYPVSLAPWWMYEPPSEKTLAKLRDARIDLAGDYRTAGKRMRDLWRVYNYVYANGGRLDGPYTIEQLGREIMPWTIDKLTWSQEKRQQVWDDIVRQVIDKYKALDPAKAKTPAQYLGERLEKLEAHQAASR